MTDPYRALCAELVELCTPVDSIPQLAERLQKLNALADRARALLAEADGPAVPDGREPASVALQPSDEELETFLVDVACQNGDMYYADPKVLARAVLARWGRPTPQPVAVSERWPNFSDCDPQERVWAWNPVLDHWKLSRINRSVHTHWLPAHALPTPEATND